MRGSKEANSPGKFMTKDLFDLVSLLNANADTHTVDTCLYQTPLHISPAYRDGIKKQLLGSADFNFRLVVALDCLGREVADTCCSIEGRAHTVEVGAEGVGLQGGVRVSAN